MISFFIFLYIMIGGDKLLKGIDISRYENGINIRALDIDFVIAKATEGVGYMDPNYKEYIETSLNSNKKVGLYHFARPDLGNSAKEEADWFVETVRPYIKKAILVLDWEKDTSNTTWAKEFLDEVYAKTEVKPIIYMSASPANSFNWSEVVRGDYGLWIASYGADTGSPGVPPQNRYWPFYILWQYTSRGYLNGYNKNLDLDYFYGTRTTWDKYANPTNETPEEPTPTPTPETKYQVGDVVTFDYLFENSYAEGKVRSRIHSGTITRIIENRPAPYLINRGSGWLSDELILSDDKNDLTIGSRVKTTGYGNASSDGSSTRARIGITGTITRILPNARYPYLVSTTAPIGWYKKEDLVLVSN